MPRIANIPISLPDNVEVNVKQGVVQVKGSKGTLSCHLHPALELSRDDGQLRLLTRQESRSARAQAGAARAILQNMVTGVVEGFEIQLEIVGVGYRAQATATGVDLTLGFSHPVNVKAPAGVTIETPSQTQILVKGADKQKVGQVAADIRRHRPPEPYKGKGIRYADEQVLRKEAKKT